MRGAALLAVFASSVAAAGDEGWDAREARFIRDQLYAQVSHLADLEAVREVFERTLANDESVVPRLIGLVGHADENVAGAAAQALGRFPGPDTSACLRTSYEHDDRVLVRMNALAGLARMKDPAAAGLATSALSDASLAIQAAGLGALKALGDAQHSATILRYMDAQSPGEADAEFLLSIGRLGDPPGSTLVRDRLLAEMNDKTNSLHVRYAAARGLKAMGLEALGRPVLDVMYAWNTHSSLMVVEGTMRTLAAERGVAISSAAEVEVLLGDVKFVRHKTDLWGQPVWAKFVEEDAFEVVSAGPDGRRGTEDDLSTAEDLSAYLDRVFPDVF